MNAAEPQKNRRRGGKREGSGRRQQWYKLPPEASDVLDELRYLRAMASEEWGEPVSRDAMLQIALTAYHRALRSERVRGTMRS
jgi:hypothetical protein